jgi:hypothetical protein
LPSLKFSLHLNIKATFIIRAETIHCGSVHHSAGAFGSVHDALICGFHLNIKATFIIRAETILCGSVHHGAGAFGSVHDALISNFGSVRYV